MMNITQRSSEDKLSKCAVNVAVIRPNSGKQLYGIIHKQSFGKVKVLYFATFNFKGNEASTHGTNTNQIHYILL